MTFTSIERGGLILSSDFLETHTDIRVLSRAVARGELLKLRRGAYVRSELWDAIKERERHLLRMRAVAEDARTPPIMAGFSAAAAHGMPVLEYPAVVTVQEEWKGGGRSAHGVRRVAAAHPLVHTVMVGDFLCTDLARTALELTRKVPFAQAVGSMDWTLWRRNPERISHDTLLAELSGLPQVFGIGRAMRVVAFASELSDSFGESMCRALMWEAGFARPRLQREIRDRQGMMVPDYSWDELGILGEFDGRGKYQRSIKPGEDLGDVVWREKKREDRLRALGFTVIRITWADLLNPDRLVQLLLDAGVPRRRR